MHINKTYIALFAVLFSVFAIAITTNSYADPPWTGDHAAADIANAQSNTPPHVRAIKNHLDQCKRGPGAIVRTVVYCMQTTIIGASASYLEIFTKFLWETGIAIFALCCCVIGHKNLCRYSRAE